MKLYSIVILYKNPNTNTATILKCHSDLSSFSFFYRNSVGVNLTFLFFSFFFLFFLNNNKLFYFIYFQEFIQFTAKLIAERSGGTSRSSVKENHYFFHCFVRQDNLVGICITDEEYQARIAFVLLNKVLIDFEQTINKSLWPNILNEKNCNYNKLPEFVTKWQDPRSADPLTKVQASFQFLFISFIISFLIIN